MRKQGTRLRNVILIVIILAAGVSGFLIFRPRGKKKYKTAVVTRGEILAQVSATGTLTPKDEVTVGSQVSGLIDTVLVDYNSFVRTGQVLARIDPRNYQAALVQAEANLVAARASLSQALREQTQAESLFRTGLISEDQLLQSRNAVELARAKVTQAAAGYEQAQTNLAYTTITAPMSGLVIARKVQKGQTVAASFSAPELFRIADLSLMQVEVSIQEADVGKIDTGMIAVFKVDAYPERTFEGRLVQIRNEPVVNQNVVTYVGIVHTANPDLLLKPGMTADVKIDVVHLPDVLVVPSTAFNPKLASQLGIVSAGAGGSRRSPGTGNRPLAKERRASPGMRTVYVLEKGKPVAREVVVGVSDSYNTEVKEGLTEGEVVILGLEQARPNPFQQSGRPPMGGFR